MSHEVHTPAKELPTIRERSIWSILWEMLSAPIDTLKLYLQTRKAPPALPEPLDNSDLNDLLQQASQPSRKPEPTPPENASVAEILAFSLKHHDDWTHKFKPDSSEDPLHYLDFHRKNVRIKCFKSSSGDYLILSIQHGSQGIELDYNERQKVSQAIHGRIHALVAEHNRTVAQSLKETLFS